MGYHGFLASAAKLRPLVVPKPKPAAPPAASGDKDGPRAAHSPPPPERERPPSHRCRYRPYLELLARTFGDDLAACDKCGGRMRVLALIKDPQSIARFLRARGESTDTLPLAPARGPPFFPAPGSPAHAAFAPEPPDESS